MGKRSKYLKRYREQPYISKVEEAYKNGAIMPGSVSLATVRHDSWCSIFKGRLCDCSPEVELQHRKVDNR
jgi:hypothetical protein